MFSKFQSDEKQLEKAVDFYNKEISEHLSDHMPLIYGSWVAIKHNPKWTNDDVLAKFYSKYGATNVEILVQALQAGKVDIDYVSKVYLTYLTPKEQTLENTGCKPRFIDHAKDLTRAMVSYAAIDGKYWHSSYIVRFVGEFIKTKLHDDDLALYADEIQSMCFMTMKANAYSVPRLSKSASDLSGALKSYPEQQEFINALYISCLKEPECLLGNYGMDDIEAIFELLPEQDKASVKAILGDKLEALVTALPDDKNDNFSDDYREEARQEIKNTAGFSRRLVQLLTDECQDVNAQDGSLSKSFNKLVEISGMHMVSRRNQVLIGQLITLNCESGSLQVLDTDLRKAFLDKDTKTARWVSVDYKAELEDRYGEMGKVLARKLAMQTHIIK